MTKKSLPHYIEVFEKRVNSQKERIKKELEKDKKHRDRKLLNHLLKDIKGIRQAIEEAKEEHAKRCPHCGHKL
jgi:DNA-directed RNA polymerase subunit RPC12/RpoP